MNSPQFKIFAGFRLSPDLKEILATEKDPSLQELTVTMYQGKEYVGLYSSSPHPTVAEIASAYDKLIRCIQTFSLDVKTSSSSFIVFPQVFLG